MLATRRLYTFLPLRLTPALDVFKTSNMTSNWLSRKEYNVGNATINFYLDDFLTTLALDLCPSYLLSHLLGYD